MMFRKMTKLGTAMLVTLAMPTLALAHTGVGTASGFITGFAHPISGLDHVLAMVLAGAFAFQLGGRALWLLPSTFVLAMAVGGALGMTGLPIPLVESFVVLSVSVLGMIVALDIKVPVGVAMGAAAWFAIFHGFAHGAEMPENVGGATFALGFMISTALLNISGIALARIIYKPGGQGSGIARRILGGMATLAGAGMLIGQL